MIFRGLALSLSKGRSRRRPFHPPLSVAEINDQSSLLKHLRFHDAGRTGAEDDDIGGDSNDTSTDTSSDNDVSDGD